MYVYNVLHIVNWYDNMGVMGDFGEMRRVRIMRDMCIM